jgi:hypothetical protein
VLSELHVLSQYRLERDLTYDELAEQIGLTGPTTYRILTVPNPKLRERTVFKIRRFVERLKQGAAA